MSILLQFSYQNIYIYFNHPIMSFKILKRKIIFVTKIIHYYYFSLKSLLIFNVFLKFTSIIINITRHNYIYFNISLNLFVYLILYILESIFIFFTVHLHINLLQFKNIYIYIY